MRGTGFFLMTAFFITAEIVAANVTADAQQRTVESVLGENNAAIGAARLTRVAHKLGSPLDQAYREAISILSKDNSCSRFFGDPKAAEEALGRLATRFRIRLLRDSKTGIQMSGNFTYFAPTESRAGYRLFAEATINTRGPFLKAKVFPSEPRVPPVGSFLPNTREARVLMLLHELAHLVKGENGSWLIPDDGNAPALSAQNTALIESRCKVQILWLTEAATNQIASN